jgi:hypothetical protein
MRLDILVLGEEKVNATSESMLSNSSRAERRERKKFSGRFKSENLPRGV